ncbi:MAG: N(4)-(beta-N-acetylglucosaminyl)-L-asparaginase [Planctomyces sp.]
MNSRRNFVAQTLTAGVAAGMTFPVARVFAAAEDTSAPKSGGKTVKPIVISTWNMGIAANEEAWKILSAGGKSLDAVEAGVKVSEADPTQTSVGYGGTPDRDGHVTLDACIMDEKSRIGCVACIEHIMHPISVARLVMEKTPHVRLVGEGALKFALDNGFKKQDLLTEETRKAWQDWLKTNQYPPVIDYRSHDTIGMLALDANGDMSGACTTSGWGYKMHGRVGDSPIIGAGLFVDNEVGGATSTGLGEEVIRCCGTHTVVEYMRNGCTPFEACKLTVERLVRKTPRKMDEVSAGFLALNMKGEYGAYAVRPGYEMAIKMENGKHELVPVEFHKFE